MTYTPVFAVKYCLWQLGHMEYCKISSWGTLQ